MKLVQQNKTEAMSKAWKIHRLSSLALFAASLNTTVLFVAFPSIQSTFSQVSATQLSWVLNAYSIVFAALLLTIGRLADQIGHRKVFLSGIGTFAIASVFCGLAPSSELLIASRILQAIGGAMIVPTSLALILAAFPKSKRSTAVSLWGAVGALAAAFGPSLGSIIVQIFGWRWAFFLNIPICIAVIILASKLPFESRELSTKDKPDFIGILLSIIGVGFMVLGIVQSGEWGWNNNRTLQSLVGGILLLIMFLVRSARIKSPTLDLKLFKDPNYRFANLTTLVFGITFTAMFFGFILFLTQVWDYSTLRAGLAITPGPLMVVVIAARTGRIADTRGHRVLIFPGGLIFALGNLLLYTQTQTTPSFFFTWLPATILIGIGVGLTLPALSSSAVHGLPSNRFALGSAVNQAINQFGSAIGVALVIVLLGQPSMDEIVNAFDRVFLLLITGGLLTSLLSIGINTGKGKLQS